MRRKLRSALWNHKLPLRAPEDFPLLNVSDGHPQIFKVRSKLRGLAFHAIRIATRGRSSCCVDRTAAVIRFANRCGACAGMVCANELRAWRIPMDSWGNLLCRWTFTQHRRIRHSEACRHRPDSVQSEHTHRHAWTVSF